MQERKMKCKENATNTKFNASRTLQSVPTDTPYPQDNFFLLLSCIQSLREGIWTWSNSYDVKVNTSIYSDIWTPNLEVGNADDCVVMTVGNGSELVWKDIPCVDVELDGKPIQVLGCEI